MHVIISACLFAHVRVTFTPSLAFPHGITCIHTVSIHTGPLDPQLPLQDGSEGRWVAKGRNVSKRVSLVVPVSSSTAGKAEADSSELGRRAERGEGPSVVVQCSSVSISVPACSCSNIKHDHFHGSGVGKVAGDRIPSWLKLAPNICIRFQAGCIAVLQYCHSLLECLGGMGKDTKTFNIQELRACSQNQQIMEGQHRHSADFVPNPDSSALKSPPFRHRPQCPSEIMALVEKPTNVVGAEEEGSQVVTSAPRQCISVQHQANESSITMIKLVRMSIRFPVTLEGNVTV